MILVKLINRSDTNSESIISINRQIEILEQNHKSVVDFIRKFNSEFQREKRKQEIKEKRLEHADRRHRNGSV